MLHVSILSGDLLGDDDGSDAKRSDNSRHVVTIAGDATIDGFVIRGRFRDTASPTLWGAGIPISAGLATVQECLLEDNHAKFGGGIGIFTSGGLTLTQSVLRHNIA